ncbi:hypothetical protein GW891_03165 [bacterium]|nr:hypothetical protein [bacterium]
MFLGFQIFSIQKGHQFFQKQPHYLPALYVEGNSIKRSDNHNKVQLKGVTTMAFAYDGYQIDKGFIEILEKLKLWKVNLLGLYADPLIIKTI